MTLSIQLPQCFICFNLFNADTELVRPSKCNHIFCRPCAEDRFSRTDMCAVCRLTCKERELVSVFVAHGTYDARALIEDAHHNEDVLVDVIMSENKRSFLTRSKRSIQLLDDLATSDPLEWRMPRSGRGNDRGLIFASVGRVMRDVGDSVEGNDEIRVRHSFHLNRKVVWYLRTFG
ncbi:hypothetical protein DFH11DRAFT_1219436 [Phellopilus nigrolimitatus]|nr:hypothetical protein DFH11DRAFT_1219436 [Phellopilus nigrolimitatus]